MRFFVCLATAASLVCQLLAAADGTGTLASPRELTLGINESTVLESATGIKRMSIANPDLAEAVAVNRNEVLLNGKARGTTSMVVWDMKGQRSVYSIQVTGGITKTDFVREQLRQELPGQDVRFDASENTVFLKGTVNDVVAADRAVAIASTLGKVVNLLNVHVPAAEPQVMLKVRFADVDRTAFSQLGFNLVSTGATNTIGAISTTQFGSQPTFNDAQNSGQVTFNDLLNIFLFRKDINLGATIQLLKGKQLLQILAEPNLLTVSGRTASFLAGGEFPFPTLQGGGSGVGQITIQFREFGIRIKFLPTVTPRGTIRLSVMPEVSALDYANSLTVSGATVPGLSTRRVQTEVELESGQSFVIAGLLDNRTTEILNKLPGLSNIPLIGKLFESRSLQKNNSELMVLVTPEVVDPIGVAAQKPNVTMPSPFIPGTSQSAPQNPASPNSKLPAVQTIPIEVMKSWSEPESSPTAPGGSGPASPAMQGPTPGPGANPAPPPMSAKSNP